MTWEEYVKSLMHSNAFEGVAILSLEHGEVLAHSANFKIYTHPAQIPDEHSNLIDFEVNEDQVILEFCKNKGVVNHPPGIWINGKHFHLLEWNDSTHVGYLKCVEGGAAIAKTKTLIVVSTWSSEVDHFEQCAENCNQAIEEISVELISKGL